MGVDATAVVMYGIKFNRDEITETLHDLKDAIYDDNENDLMIYDGMCGNYMCFGHIFTYQSVHDDFDFVEIKIDDLSKIEKDYRREFAFKYPEWSEVLEGKEFKLLSFVHYS